jgi:DnaJ family protein C protein 19
MVLLGAVVLLVFLGGMHAFANASVSSVRSLFAWIAALGGISLALLLILSGRGAVGLFALSLAYPLLQDWWAARRRPGAGRPAAGSRPGDGRGSVGSRTSGRMTPEEALDVLGLRAGASEAEIRAAHRRLMRGVHPDSGGSDWLASRINQARDVLLAAGRAPG